MSSVVKLLNEGLEEDPSNWDLRIELAQKLVENGDAGGAANTIASGESNPANDAQLHQALELAGGHTNAGNWDTILKSFVEANPASGYGHRILASHLLVLDQPDQARKHYDAAIAIEPSYADPDFEASIDSHASGGEEHVDEAEGEVIAAAANAIPHETGAVSVVTKAEEAPEAASTGSDPVTPKALRPPGEDDVEEHEAHEEPPVPEIHEVHAEDVPHEYDVGEDGEGHERYLVTQEGEAIHAADQESTRNSKISAILVAVVVHLVIAALLILAKVALPPNKPPQIIGTAAPNENAEDMENVKMEKQQVQPTAQSASTQMQVTTAFSASSFAVPEFDSTNMTFEPLGMGDSFGPSMSFAGDDSGSMVSFFGSKSSATKVVFVVDASASMKSTGKNGRTKFSLMQEELTRTVKSLPPGVEFQILFFSGPSWFVGEWDKKTTPKDWQRHAGGGNFWEYKGGDPENWPEFKYLKATPSTIRRVAKMIEETPMVGGTDWRDPLKMAMTMEPDVIYFMTDGAVGKHPDKKPVVDDVLDFNRTKSKAKINSICFMVLKAYENLKELADKTRGEFTLVTEDGEILRGRDVEKLANK